MHQRIVCGAAFSIAVAAFGALLTWIIVPPIVQYMVDQNVILYANSDQFERFVNTPQPLHFKVYLFNVTNLDRVIGGDLPHVQELGPYVFSQYRTKTVHNVSEDGMRINYTQRQQFVFNQKESGRFTQDDHIVALNIPMNSLLLIVDKGLRRAASAVRRGINDTLEQIPLVRTAKHLLDALRGNRRSLLQTAEETAPATLGVLNKHIGSMFGDPKSVFVRTTPRQLLFEGIRFCVQPHGMAELMCEVMRGRGLNTIEVGRDKSLQFAMFKYKNETHDGFYSVHSGVNDALQVGDIKAWQNRSQLAAWKSQPPACNRIAGTDAGMFPPHRKPEGSILIFSTDICRTVEIFYEEPITYRGIGGLRFGTTDSFLNEIGPEFGTECYCTDTVAKVPRNADGCLLKGALDMSACHGAPIVLTQPHMLGASSTYQSSVRGLHADPQKHRTFVDIEPNTGYPLRGGKRVQFNMFVRQIDQIHVTRNLRTTLLPILWVDEGINLDDKMIRLLNDKLFNYLFLLDVLTWMMMVGGLLGSILLLTWSYYKSRQSNKIYVFT